MRFIGFTAAAIGGVFWAMTIVMAAVVALVYIGNGWTLANAGWTAEWSAKYLPTYFVVSVICSIVFSFAQRR